MSTTVFTYSSLFLHQYRMENDLRVWCFTVLLSGFSSLSSYSLLSPWSSLLLPAYDLSWMLMWEMNYWVMLQMLESAMSCLQIHLEEDFFSFTVPFSFSISWKELWNKNKSTSQLEKGQCESFALTSVGACPPLCVGLLVLSIFSKLLD